MDDLHAFIDEELKKKSERLRLQQQRDDKTGGADPSKQPKLDKDEAVSETLVPTNFAAINFVWGSVVFKGGRGRGRRTYELQKICYLTQIQISRFYFEIEMWMVQFVLTNRNTFLCVRSRRSFGCPGRRRSTSSPTSAVRSTSWRTRTGRTGKSTSSTRSCPGEMACLFVCLLRGHCQSSQFVRLNCWIQKACAAFGLLLSCNDVNHGLGLMHIRDLEHPWLGDETWQIMSWLDHDAVPGVFS